MWPLLLPRQGRQLCDDICLFVFFFLKQYNSNSCEWILMTFSADVGDILKNSTCLLMVQITEELWPLFAQESWSCYFLQPCFTNLVTTTSSKRTTTMLFNLPEWIYTVYIYKINIQTYQLLIPTLSHIKSIRLLYNEPTCSEFGWGKALCLHRTG